MSTKPILQQNAATQLPFEPDRIITGEEFYALRRMIGPAELVEGRIVRRMPTGYLHGYFETIIAALLFNFVQLHKLGRVFTGEVGLYVRRAPDTIRGVDVAFISHERYARVQSQSYLDVCPELMVEVMSPDDSWSEVHAKLAEYFAIEARLVWVVDPRLKQIHVYRSLDDVSRLTRDDELTGGDVLPGFRVAVREILNDAE